MHCRRPSRKLCTILLCSSLTIHSHAPYSKQCKDYICFHIAPACLVVNAIATVSGKINDAARRCKPQLHSTHKNHADD